jgi:pimeloyl-ACP methyl ester carboxylesterase
MNPLNQNPKLPHAPGFIKLALESRAPWEHAAYFAAKPALRFAPKGDGHSVLVLPGFVAGDHSTWLLRRFLKERGYDAHGWLQGRNLGPKPGVLEASLVHLKQLAELSGRKVSLVGWSLGGIYARELAKMAPDLVRCVISLGSPFGGPGRATNAWWLYKAFNPDHKDVGELESQLAEPPSVPTTAIFSRTDGVVAWQGARHTTAQLAAHPLIENVEVEASHVGMGANPLALWVVADRLGQTEGQWKRFDRVGWRALAFRDPERERFVF